MAARARKRNGNPRDPTRSAVNRRGHRRGRPPPVDARLRRVERRQHQRPDRRRSPADDARQRVEGLHDAGHDGRHRPRGHARVRRAGPQAVVRDPDASGRVPRAARRRRRRPRASAALDRLRRGGHSARSRRAGRGRDDAWAAFRLRSTARRRRSELADAVAPYVSRTTACCSPITARWRSGRICSARTTRWRRSSTSRGSAWWRACSAASTCSRAKKSLRLQGLRGRYGIAAPAPICPDPTPADAGRSELPGRRRAVGARRAARAGHASPSTTGRVGTGGEIRLTYAQLTTLIDEAVSAIAKAKA